MSALNKLNEFLAKLNEFLAKKEGRLIFCIWYIITGIIIAIIFIIFTSVVSFYDYEINLSFVFFFVTSIWPLLYVLSILIFSLSDISANVRFLTVIGIWVAPLFSFLIIFLVIKSIKLKKRSPSTGYTSVKSTSANTRHDSRTIRQNQQLEDLLTRIKRKLQEANVKIHDEDFLQAKKIFQVIEKDFQLTEVKSTLLIPMRRKVQEKRSDLKLPQKIRDMDVLASYSQITLEKHSIKELAKQGKIDNALQRYNQALKKLESIEPVVKKYKLESLQRKIQYDTREIKQLYIDLEEKLKLLIDELDQPVQIERPIPKKERFYCQLCSEYHSKMNESYYECTSCNRSQCLDCYLDSIKAGKNTCLFCNGSLEFHKSAKTMEVDESK